MIALMMASAINLAAAQAAIAAPTDAFRGCLREASAKAESEKVTGDAVEEYLRNACTVQMGSLKSALVAFRMKNGMTKKAADSDASMTVDDYVATPVDNYKFMADMRAKANGGGDKPAATPAAAPAAAPASTPPAK